MCKEGSGLGSPCVYMCSMHVNTGMLMERCMVCVLQGENVSRPQDNVSRDACIDNLCILIEFEEVAELAPKKSSLLLASNLHRMLLRTLVKE